LQTTMVYKTGPAIPQNLNSVFSSHAHALA